MITPLLTHSLNNMGPVDVYIDGTYSGRAELRTDPSEVGNFVYRPRLLLKPNAPPFLWPVALDLLDEKNPVPLGVRPLVEADVCQDVGFGEVGGAESAVVLVSEKFVCVKLGGF